MAYSERRAEYVIAWIEKHLRHTKGRFAGTPFILREWQKDIVRKVFGTVHADGNRQYQTVYLEISRKNGKSEIAAAIALYLLLADGERGAEIYSAAADRNQASVVFKAAASMVRLSPALRRRCRITPTTRTIYVSATDSIYRVLSADGPRQHGLNPSGVIFDEVHTQKNRDLWEALTTGSGTRNQPLFFAVTTAGVIGESPLWEELNSKAKALLAGERKDPTFLPILYVTEPQEDWTDPKVWKKANPALGDFLRMDKFEAEFQSALESPLEENSFKRLKLCMPTQQDSVWIPLPAWDANQRDYTAESLFGRTCYAGLDLSTKWDLTALVLVFPEDDDTFKLLPFGWMPKAQIVKRSKQDRVPYDAWARDGHIEATPGQVVDYRAIRAKVNELGKQYDIQQIGFDPREATQLTLELADDGFSMVEILQNPRHMSDPAKEFERLVISGKLHHNGHPVLRSHVASVSVRQDSDDQIKLVKPDRLKSTKRIDMVVASVIGLGRASANSVPEAPSIYADPLTAVM